MVACSGSFTKAANPASGCGSYPHGFKGLPPNATISTFAKPMPFADGTNSAGHDPLLELSTGRPIGSDPLYSSPLMLRVTVPRTKFDLAGEQVQPCDAIGAFRRP